MKSKFKFLRFLAALMMIFALLFALAAPAPAQVVPGNFLALTNLPAQINVATASNQTSVIPLFNNSGLALQWSFKTPATATSNVVARLYATADGTNYGTVPFAEWTAVATGTTTVIATTNWSADQLRGYKALSFGMYSNQNAAAVVTNLYVYANRPTY